MDKARAATDRDYRRYEIDGDGYYHAGNKQQYKKDDKGHLIQYKGEGNRKDYPYSPKSDNDRDRKTQEVIEKYRDERSKNPRPKTYGNSISLRHIDDAVNRHIRRHPEQYKESCGIFYTVTSI